MDSTLMNNNNVQMFASVFMYLCVNYVLSKNAEYLKNLYDSSKVYRVCLDTFKKIHNFMLMMFSGYIAYNMYFEINPTYLFVFPPSFMYSKTVSPSLQHLLWLFTYSKTYEYLDTWLMMARGSKTIFLQKYHHFGAVVMWYMTTQYIPLGGSVSTYYNSIVHTVMYLYYLLCCFKIKFPGFIRQSITTIQLIQLVVAVSYGTYIGYFETSELYSPQFASIVVADLYTFILIGLFINFYSTNYLKNKKSIQTKKNS